jgi:hypothetical protein
MVRKLAGDHSSGLLPRKDDMEYLIIIAFAVLAYEYFYGGMR